MGAKSPDRMQRLRSLREPGRGFLWLAVCENCGHIAGFPVRQLIAKFGELFPVESAVTRLRCDECSSRKVAARLVRLCDQACRRNRD